MFETIVAIAAILLCIGFAAWLVGKLPMVKEPYQELVQGVLIIATILWLLGMLVGAIPPPAFPLAGDPARG